MYGSYRAVCLLLALLMSSPVMACHKGQATFSQLQNTQSFKLLGPLDVLELEKAQTTQGKPSFGTRHEDWEAIKQQFQVGDEIYTLQQQDGVFEMQGILQVREGCVIEFLFIS